MMFMAGIDGGSHRWQFSKRFSSGGAGSSPIVSSCPAVTTEVCHSQGVAKTSRPSEKKAIKPTKQTPPNAVKQQGQPGKSKTKEVTMEKQPTTCIKPKNVANKSVAVGLSLAVWFSATLYP